MALRYDQLKDEIHTNITGVNRYNPNNIELLEQRIQHMVREVKYDKNILFLLNPQKYNEAIVAPVLPKAMMVYPRSDYALAVYLIDPGRAQALELRMVIDIGTLPESINFCLFWRLCRSEAVAEEADKGKFKSLVAGDVKRLTDSVVGFEDAVRVYACQMISMIFQRIDKPQLKFEECAEVMIRA